MLKGYGRYITKLRKERRYSLRQLAHKMGYSHSYLYEIEQERRRPSDRFLDKLIKNLELSDKEIRELFALIEKDMERYQTPLEEELRKILEETGIIVGGYTGKLSDNTIMVLIKEISEWRKELGI